MFPELLAHLRQELHADANAEHRRVGGGSSTQRVDQVVPAQTFHAVRKSADAGQHDSRRLADRRGIGRDLGSRPNTLHRGNHRADIRDAAVDDRDHAGSDDGAFATRVGTLRAMVARLRETRPFSSNRRK